MTLEKPPGGRLLRNILSGWVVFGVAVVSGFILTPYILHRVGTENYGLWVLAASLSGYLGLFDFGWGPAVTAQVGEAWDAGQTRSAQEHLGAAFWLHLGAGVLVMTAALVMALVAGRVFALTPSDLPIARKLILVTGLTVAVGLPLSVFSTALAGGLFRHDLANGVELGAAGARVVMTVAIMETTASITQLAWGVFIIATAAHLVRLAVLRRRWPGLSIRRPPWRHPAWRRFGRFAGWGFLWIAAERLLIYLGALIVGIRFSAGATAIWGIGAKFGEYLRLAARSAADVHLSLLVRRNEIRTTPKRQAAAQSQSIVLGTVLSAAIMLWINGDLLLRWWIGDIARDAAVPMRWMILAGVSAALGFPAQAAWIARGKPRFVALMAAGLTAIVAFLAAFVSKSFGLTGVAMAISIPTAAVWGIVLPLTLRGRQARGGRHFGRVAANLALPVLISLFLQVGIWALRSMIGDNLRLAMSLVAVVIVIGVWITAIGIRTHSVDKTQ